MAILFTGSKVLFVGRLRLRPAREYQVPRGARAASAAQFNADQSSGAALLDIIRGGRSAEFPSCSRRLTPDMARWVSTLIEAIRHIEHTRLEAQTWPEANEPMADAHGCLRKWGSSEASSRAERSDGCAARVSVLEVQVQVPSCMGWNFHAGLCDDGNSRMIGRVADAVFVAPSSRVPGRTGADPQGSERSGDHSGKDSRFIRNEEKLQRSPVSDRPTDAGPAVREADLPCRINLIGDVEPDRPELVI